MLEVYAIVVLKHFKFIADRYSFCPSRGNGIYYISSRTSYGMAFYIFILLEDTLPFQFYFLLEQDMNFQAPIIQASSYKPCRPTVYAVEYLYDFFFPISLGNIDFFQSLVFSFSIAKIGAQNKFETSVQSLWIYLSPVYSEPKWELGG